jgi:ssRNA-specific RNase YbeY (16S rRNA maturation enzyme)
VQHLGEIIISFPQAVLQSSEHGYSVKEELAALIIQGYFILWVMIMNKLIWSRL